MRKMTLKKIGFNKVYPLGFEGQDRVSYMEMEVGGLTLISQKLGKGDDHGVIIYEGGVYYTIKDQKVLEELVSVLKKLQGGL